MTIHIVVVTIEIVTTTILVCWGYINKTFCWGNKVFSSVNSDYLVIREVALKIGSGSQVRRGKFYSLFSKISRKYGFFRFFDLTSREGRFLLSVACVWTGNIGKVLSHRIKGFVIPTKSVEIGTTKILCYNNKMFSSINETLGCCSKSLVAATKKIFVVPKPFFPCTVRSTRKDLEDPINHIISFKPDLVYFLVYKGQTL